MNVWPWPPSLWLVVLAVDVLTIGHAVMRGRHVYATLAWVFAIAAFPFGGALAYFLVGSPSLRYLSRKKALKVRQARGSAKARSFPKESNPQDVSDLRGWDQVFSALTGFVGTPGNTVELLAENEEAVEHIRRALQGAKRSIWAEYYIIRNDGAGRQFLDLLEEKARAGVEVRLLYDALGSLGIDAACLDRIRRAGGQAVAFLPISPFRRRWATHLRNHRKIILVDHDTAFVGSLNIGDEYAGSLRRRRGMTFRDVHLSVKGPAVGDLISTFAKDWLFAAGDPVPPVEVKPEGAPGQSWVAVVPSDPYQEQNAHGLVFFTGITSARERCYLTSPYFVPDEPTLRALVSAALRGVDVRLLVPGHSDVPLVLPAARSFYGTLIRAGVKIFEHHHGFLHAKTMVVDGRWGIVGSANVDMRSFQWNYEIGAWVWDRQVAKALERIFLALQHRSTGVTLEALARGGTLTRLGRRMARLLSPLL